MWEESLEARAENGMVTTKEAKVKWGHFTKPYIVHKNYRREEGCKNVADISKWSWFCQQVI